MSASRHFYRIGEVSALVDVPTHVLRYWESEFPQLNPKKGGGGQRLYQPDDISRLKVIKALLYDEGFTIEGARKALSSTGTSGPTAAEIDQVASELTSLAAELVA